MNRRRLSRLADSRLFLRNNPHYKRATNTKQHLTVICVMVLMLIAGSLAQAQILVFSTVEGSVTPIAEKVLIEAYKRMGTTIELQFFPPIRALKEANTGSVDGDLHRKQGLERTYPNLIAVPVPIINIDEIVFTKRENAFLVKGWESLLPYSVGYRRGIRIIEDNLVEGTKAEAVGTLEQLFRKLENGRNDIVIETRLSGLTTINKLKLNDIVMLEPPIISLPLFHYLHIKNKHLVEPLTKVLQQMEKEGIIQDIHKKAWYGKSPSLLE